jgi:hypothetical protein
MILALSVIHLSVGARSSFGQFDDLILRVPGAANSLVLIDVDGVYASPMGRLEKSSARAGDQFPGIADL